MPRLHGTRRVRGPAGPVTYQQVLSAHAELIRVVDRAERHYKISDRAVASVLISGMECFEVVLYLEENDKKGSFTLSTSRATPAELVKAAEIKAMVDAWIAGRLEALPPSTIQIKDDDDD